MSFETDLVSACAAVVSNRLYPAADPGNQNPALPFATYQVIADQELDRYLSGRTTKAQVRVQINVYGATLSDIAAKVRAMRTALETAYGDQLSYYERGADLPGDETTIMGRYIDALINCAA